MHFKKLNCRYWITFLQPCCFMYFNFANLFYNLTLKKYRFACKSFSYYYAVQRIIVRNKNYAKIAKI